MLLQLVYTQIYKTDSCPGIRFYIEKGNVRAQVRRVTFSILEDGQEFRDRDQIFSPEAGRSL